MTNMLVGSKLRAKLGASLNESASAPTSDFAQKQLEQMGWKEGEGLGKRRQGMSSHIRVKKRQDQAGLGAAAAVAATHASQEQWWKVSVNDTLSKLKSGTGKSKKRKKHKTREYTDQELFEATGGARFGMRAQRRATAKWARTESQTEEEERAAMEKVEWNGRGQVNLLDKNKERQPPTTTTTTTKQPRKRKKSSSNSISAANIATTTSTTTTICATANETSEVDDSNGKQRKKDKRQKKARKKMSKKEKKRSKRSKRQDGAADKS